MSPKFLAIPLVLTIGFVLSGIVLSDENPKKEKQKPQVKPIKIQAQLKSTDPFDWQRSSSYHRVHSVKLKRGVLYTLSMTANFPPYLRLEDFRGNQVAYTNQFRGRNTSLEFAPEKDEVFRVVATSLTSRATGPYTLDIKPRITLLMVQDKLTGKEPFDRLRPQCYYKVHKLKMVPGNTYTIHCKTTINDGWLRLEDSKKTKLAFNDDWMDTRNSRIVFTPTKADTYRIIVTTCGSRTTGPYTLTVTK